MIKKKFNQDGFEVELWDFGYAKFFYPTFNGNAEFPVSADGFRKLRHYLRTVNWLRNGMLGFLE